MQTTKQNISIIKRIRREFIIMLTLSRTSYQQKQKCIYIFIFLIFNSFVSLFNVLYTITISSTVVPVISKGDIQTIFNQKEYAKNIETIQISI